MNEKKNIDIATQAYSQTEISKDEILERLRKKGCRVTKQRRALIDVILQEKCTCCKEIYYIARKTMPDIGMATIYRMLSTMEEVGAIKRESMYRICCKRNNSIESCRVELDNHAFVELNAESLNKIIQKGMEACGISSGKKVVHVMFHGCDGSE